MLNWGGIFQCSTHPAAVPSNKKRQIEGGRVTHTHTQNEQERERERASERCFRCATYRTHFFSFQAHKNSKLLNGEKSPESNKWKRIAVDNFH